MPIVRNFTDLNTPDVFLREAEPAASVRGAGIGVVGFVAQTIRGPVGVSTVISDMADFTRKFGGFDRTLPEGFMFAHNLFKQGASVVKVLRVTDGTEATASCTLTGAASGTVFELTTPGTWGNDVTLTVAESTVTGYVDLTFKYGSQETFAYRQVTFTDTTDERYFADVIEASSDDFVVIDTEGTANPAAGDYSFSGGTNGTTVGASAADTVYTEGIDILEADEELNFIASARATDTINVALRDHAASVSVSPRIAIVAPPSGSTVDDVKAMMASYNNDQVIVTYPWVQILNPYTNRKEYHTPVSFYAGLLSTLSYEQSPSRKQILGVIGTERALTRAEVDVLSQYRVSPITLLPGQGFVVRNGLNTSANPAKANITRRRAVNFFAKTFEAGAQQFVSRPHTVALRNDVKSAFGSLIQNELALGRIGNVNGGKAYAVKCDDQNNPNEVVRANRMIVDVQISLLAPADFILITLDASEAKVITLE